MPILVVCSSCAARLKVGDHLLGKRVKCASCGQPTVVAPPKPAAEPETGLIELKPIMPSVAAEEPRPKTNPPAPPEEKLYDSVDEDELPDDRPKKKKKKKKRKRNPAWALASAESRPLLLFGGSGILAIEFFLLAAAVIAPNNPLRFIMAYFFLMLPISTVIFMGSLYVASLFGAAELGEVAITLVKGFFLALVVNIVALFPYGLLFAAFVWAGGIFLMFHFDGCDVWIVRILIGINCTLNLIAQLLVISVLMAIIPIPLNDDFAENMPAGQNQIWDARMVERLGGRVRFADDDEEAVTVISLANRPIRDADLAHMKDFPWLHRLDLANTLITDKGLAHLRECQKLDVLTLTGTRVTEAGVRELQMALPKTRIVR
jgi:hypothetical protein